MLTTFKFSHFSDCKYIFALFHIDFVNLNKGRLDKCSKLICSSSKHALKQVYICNIFLSITSALNSFEEQTLIITHFQF